MRAAGTALVFLAALLAARAGWARPHLVTATPAAGAHVHPGKLTVTLTFDRDLDPVRGRIMLLGPAGPPQLLMVPPPATPRVLTADLDVVAGAYTLQWAASDKDDAQTTGSIGFTVAP